LSTKETTKNWKKSFFAEFEAFILVLKAITTIFVLQLKQTMNVKRELMIISPFFYSFASVSFELKLLFFGMGKKWNENKHHFLPFWLLLSWNNAIKIKLYPPPHLDSTSKTSQLSAYNNDESLSAVRAFHRSFEIFFYRFWVSRVLKENENDFLSWVEMIFKCSSHNIYIQQQQEKTKRKLKNNAGDRAMLKNNATREALRSRETKESE
jgi:hypothetical protein